jgi:hypothetical protein
MVVASALARSGDAAWVEKTWNCRGLVQPSNRTVRDPPTGHTKDGASLALRTGALLARMVTGVHNAPPSPE